MPVSGCIRVHRLSELSYAEHLHREQLVYRHKESIVASEQKRMAGKVWLGFDYADNAPDLSNLD